MPYAQRGNRTFQEIWLFKEQFLCHIYRHYHTDFAPLYEVAARQLWLTALVFLEGILWCAALDRMRDMM